MGVLVAVTSLLLSTALLLLGHGMQLTLLPLRAGINGMPESLIGYSASCYFFGFVIGCLAVPRLISRVGHIRCFAVLAAIMVSAILCLEMLDLWQAWMVLRFTTGVAVCGLYAVIESWLTSQSTPESRGRILAVYTFITLAAMTAGQFLINVGSIDGSVPFTLAAIFMALAIVPVGLTRRMAPAPVQATQSGFRLLFQRSHSAFFGAMLSGLVVGSFWSLGAVFAGRLGQGQMQVTWFMSAAIAGGAIFQYPVGWLSDRLDRRHILITLAIGGALSSVAVALSAGQPWHLFAVLLFGAMVMPLYAISLATAADVSSSDEFVAIGTSVLLLHSIGAVIAPLALGKIMTLFGATALFWATAVLCALFSAVLYGFTRKPRAISVEEQIPFNAAAAEVAPMSFELDPRGPEVDATASVPAGSEPEKE